MLKNTIDRAEKVQAVAELFDELYKELLDLTNLLGIAKTELKKLTYETIATEETEIKKITKRGMRVYHYTQLKGFIDRKTYTLKTWRVEATPASALSELIRVYRACRHLQKALNYL